MTQALIIGNGSAGGRFFEALRKRGVSCTKVGSRQFDNQQVNALTKNVNLVIIASPAPCHIRHAKVAFSHGVRKIIIEKPLCSYEPEQLVEAAAISEEMQSCVRIVYPFFLSSKLWRLKQLIDSAAADEIQSVYLSSFSNIETWRPGRELSSTVSLSAKLGGGCLNELSHELQLMIWLFGDLQPLLAYEGVRKYQHFNVIQDITAVCTNVKGLKVNLALSFTHSIRRREIIINGTNGTIHVDLTGDTSQGLIGCKKIVVEPIAVLNARIYDECIKFCYGEPDKMLRFDESLRVVKLAKVVSDSMAVVF